MKKSRQVCQGGYVETSYSCQKSRQVCVAEEKTGACNSYSSEKYNSGQGGSNFAATSLTNVVKQNGVRTGNGTLSFVFKGE